MSADQTRPRIKLLDWKPLHKGALRGFCNVALENGIVLREITVFQKDGRIWAGMPSRPRLDRAGRPILNHAGHPQRDQLAGWVSRELADQFSEALADIFRAAHAVDLDGGGR